MEPHGPAFAACLFPAPAARWATPAASHAQLQRPRLALSSRPTARRSFLCQPSTDSAACGLRSAWIGSPRVAELARRLEQLSARAAARVARPHIAVAEQEQKGEGERESEAGPSEPSSAASEAAKGPLDWLVPREGWDVPWESPTIYAVLLQWFLSYLACGLLVLPLAAKQLGLDVTDARGQSLFLLANYMTEMGIGFYVLNSLLEPFFPLGERGLFRYNPTPGTIGAGVVGFLWAIPVVIIASLINQTVLNGGQVELQEITGVLLKAQDDPLSVFIFVFTVAFLAPVWEETMFRGFLLTSLTRYFPTWGAIGISGVVFAGAHMSPQHMIPLTALGWVLGIVYTRTRSLATSIALHAMWNSITVAALLSGLADKL